MVLLWSVLYVLIMCCLCMLVFTCDQVYNDVVVVVMDEVTICVVDMVMH